MNKKVLNCALYVLLSFFTITILPACSNADSIDNIVGFWKIKSDNANEILTITPSSITVNNMPPMPSTFIIDADKIILTVNHGVIQHVNIINKNEIHFRSSPGGTPRIYMRIDEETAKQLNDDKK